MKTRSKRLAVFCALLGVAGLLVLYGEPLFTGHSLVGPDYPAHGAALMRSRLPGSFLGRWSSEVLGNSAGILPLHPSRLLLLVLPPLVFHTVSYMFNTVALVLAMIYLLRVIGLRGPAVWIAALTMGFSCHSFTLIAAGHIGKFEVLPFAVLMLAFIHRAVERNSLFYYALSGTSVAFGFAAQQDVMFLFALLGAAYGLFCLFQFRPQRREQLPRYVALTVAGAAVAAAFFVGVALPSLETFRREISVVRENPKVGQPAAERYEFSTDWSLPPEDALEFVAPCIYGIETANREAPYWGRLGETLNWQTRGGRRNLRQHTVYIGVVQLVFVALLLFLILDRRGQSASVFRTKGLRSQAIFWLITLILAVLLSLGRYFPLYRLLYIIPPIRSMRGPVKIMHLVEVAVVMLFAIGLYSVQGLVGSTKRPGGRDRRSKVPAPALGPLLFTSIACFAAMIGMIIGIPLVSGTSSVFMPRWRALGIDIHASILGTHAAGALAHGAVLFAVSGAILLVLRARVRRRRSTAWVMPLIATIVVIDLVSVDLKYVTTQDLSAFYDSNPVIEYLHQQDQPFRLSCPFNEPPFAQWKHFMLSRHLIDKLEPSKPLEPGSEYARFFTALNPKVHSERLWQITNTRFILGTADYARALARHPDFELAMLFDIGRTGAITKPGYGSGRYGLVKYNRCLPRAYVVYGWSASERDASMSGLADPSWDPRTTALLGAESDSRVAPRPMTAASVVSYRPQEVKIEATAEDDGILVLADKYDHGWTAYVDGARAPIFRCNYLMRGLRISKGKHTVVYRYRPYARATMVTISTLIVLVLWALGSGLLTRFSRRAASSTENLEGDRI